MIKKSILLSFAVAAAAVSSAHAQMIFTIGTAGTVASTNNWPAGEQPGLINDGTMGTKYLNFAKLNTGYVFTPVTGNTIVTGIKFATANDAEVRDPASYILYGSNTLTASNVAGTTLNVTSGFTKVSEGVLTLPAARLTAGGDVTFANTTTYNTYLLVFPTVKDAAAANSMQIGEARLQLTNGDQLTSFGTLGGGQLSTVPEAGSAALLGLSALGLLSRRRRA